MFCNVVGILIVYCQLWGGILVNDNTAELNQIIEGLRPRKSQCFTTGMRNSSDSQKVAIRFKNNTSQPNTP